MVASSNSFETFFEPNGTHFPRGKKGPKFPKIWKIYFSCLWTTQAFPRTPVEFNPIQFLFENDIFILILYLNVRGLYKTRFVWKEIKLC